MDLLGPDPVLRLKDPSWKIYSRHDVSAPHFVGKTARIVDSSVTDGCDIEGEVRHSVLGPDVTVEPGATVGSVNSREIGTLVGRNAGRIENVFVNLSEKLTYNSQKRFAGAMIGNHVAGAPAIFNSWISSFISCLLDSPIPSSLSSIASVNRQAQRRKDS